MRDVAKKNDRKLKAYAALFASRGGRARARKLSSAKRREIARAAALARWGRRKRSAGK